MVLKMFTGFIVLALWLRSTRRLSVPDASLDPLPSCRGPGLAGWKPVPQPSDLLQNHRIPADEGDIWSLLPLSLWP